MLDSICIAALVVCSIVNFFSSHAVVILVVMLIVAALSFIYTLCLFAALSKRRKTYVQFNFGLQILGTILMLVIVILACMTIGRNTFGTAILAAIALANIVIKLWSFRITERLSESWREFVPSENVCVPQRPAARSFSLTPSIAPDAGPPPTYDSLFPSVSIEYPQTLTASPLLEHQIVSCNALPSEPPPPPYESCAFRAVFVGNSLV